MGYGRPGGVWEGLVGYGRPGGVGGGMGGHVHGISVHRMAYAIICRIKNFCTGLYFL